MLPSPAFKNMLLGPADAARLALILRSGPPPHTTTKTQLHPPTLKTISEAVSSTFHTGIDNLSTQHLQRFRVAATVVALLKARSVRCSASALCPCFDIGSASSRYTSERRNEHSDNSVDHCPRVAARFLLLDLFRTPLAHNPFLPEIVGPTIHSTSGGHNGGGDASVQGKESQSERRSASGVFQTSSRGCCVCERSFGWRVVRESLQERRGARRTSEGLAVRVSKCSTREIHADWTRCRQQQQQQRQQRQRQRQRSGSVEVIDAAVAELLREYWERIGEPDGMVSAFSHSSLLPLVPFPCMPLHAAGVMPASSHSFAGVDSNGMYDFESFPSLAMPAEDVVNALAASAGDLQHDLHTAYRASGELGPEFAVPSPPLFESAGDLTDSDVHWLQPSLCSLLSLEVRAQRAAGSEDSSSCLEQHASLRFGSNDSLLDLLLWDDTMYNTAELFKEAAFREEIFSATIQPLLPAVRKRICTTFVERPELVYRCGLTPERLVGLVENNSTIAFEFIFTMMQHPRVALDAEVDDEDSSGRESHVRAMEYSHGQDIAAFLSALLTVELSLQSMEVVTRLTSAVELPPEFVNLYVSNCLRRCEEVEDRTLQNRLVRLVCVVLQSFISQGTLKDRNLFVEVQRFCIEFSKIREAVGLFKLLKSLESTS